MCGIAGIIDFAGRPIAEDLLEAMARSLRHRGPDDRGTWHYHDDGFSAGLAHTRLAVIDPSPQGHQPMLDRTGRWAISYNGELYNFRALAARLPQPPRTACDTEVALEACAAWGPQALSAFDGMWAMAVVNPYDRQGHLSRDPLGIKPLYYAFHDRKLVFASELAALRQVPGLPWDIDGQALACYLRLGWIPHPLTIYRHVRKLAPGHLLSFDATGPSVPTPFFRLPEPVDPPPAYPEACELVRSAVERAVHSQQVADVPLGAFLSGGLDSSVVVACLARASGRPVRTFSIGYAGHSRYDETGYARMVARHLGTEHQEIRLSFGDVLEAVEPMLERLGEPFGDSSILPTALVSRHTRKAVTVALSGDGGDELFGGYWKYAGHAWLRRYRRLPSALRKGFLEPFLERLPDARSTRLLDRIRQARKLVRGDLDDPLERHLAWTLLTSDAEAARLLGDQVARDSGRVVRAMYRDAPGRWGRGGPVDPLEAVLLADLAVGLPADMLHKVDAASMACSLEVRVPLLQRDLVGLVAGLPVDYKIRGVLGKRILRDAFADLLPGPVLVRPKMGFEVPVGEFLRHELKDMYRDVVRRTTLEDLGLCPEAAQRLFDEHLSRRRDHCGLLWSLLVLAWWKRAQGQQGTKS